MKSSIFEYNSYKSYVKERIESEEPARGLKMRIAEHILCQPSYLSQVLNGHPDFTLEQASRLSTFLQHTPLESRYFILLVELARAGTEDLKDIFRQQINEIQKTRFDLKQRLSDTEEIPESAQLKYYSAWFYSAIHVALAVPELQTPQKIAEKFHLPVPLVAEVIDFLLEIGLVQNHRGGYKFTKKSIFLGRSSDFIRLHHINWRSQSLQAVEKNLPENLHYSNVIAISEADFETIKEILAKAIENARKLIGPSKEENVYAMTVDLFRL